MTLASISYIFKAFIEKAIIFIEGAATFIKGAVIFISETMIFISRTVTFIGKAVTFINKAMTFIGKGSSAIGRLFKIAETGVVNDIKEANKCDLRQQLMIYKLKGPLLLIVCITSSDIYCY